MRAQKLIPPLACLLMLMWGWRVYRLQDHLPSPEAYGDPFEVMWLIDLFYDAVRQGRFPELVRGVWHPVGLVVGALGYTPATFFMMMPLRAVSNAAFTFNVMTLLGLCVCFATTYRLARRFADVWPATLAGLLFAFAPYQWERVINAHPNILWAVALLPLYIDRLLNVLAANANANANANETDRADQPRWRYKLHPQGLGPVLEAGLWWGLIMSLQLYGVWWGGLCWAIAWVFALRQKRVLACTLVLLIAFAVAAPTLIYFFLASRNAQLVTDAMPALVGWGASVNSLFVPSVSHPVAAVRALAQAVYTGIRNESGIANWGTLLLGVALAAIAKRGQLTQSPDDKLAWRFVLTCGLAGFILALGFAVKWDGHAVRAPALAGLSDGIWALGRAVKPQLFSTPAPVDALTHAIPTPGYVFVALLPLWESARVYARFSFVGGLAMALLAAAWLQRTPRLLGFVLSALLLLEVLPAPTNNWPVPTRNHTAYEWIAAQENTGDWNILDLSDEPNFSALMHGGKVLFGARQHGLNVAAGFGSYPVRHMHELRLLLQDAPLWARSERVLYFLRMLKTRYVLVHGVHQRNTRVWDGIRASPYFAAQGCFAARPGDLWPHEICVARVQADSLSPLRVIPAQGWSLEPWGGWATETTARANWLAERADAHTLQMRVFPNCDPARNQSIKIYANSVPVFTHTWANCDEAELRIALPASAVKLGWNTLHFEFSYAAPAQNDVRTLAVGFSQLHFQPNAP